MPACSTPTSWVTTMVRMGNTMPHTPTPMPFHTKSRVVRPLSYSACCWDRLAAAHGAQKPVAPMVHQPRDEVRPALLAMALAVATGRPLLARRIGSVGLPWKTASRRVGNAPFPTVGERVPPRSASEIAFPVRSLRGARKRLRVQPAVLGGRSEALGPRQGAGRFPLLDRRGAPLLIPGRPDAGFPLRDRQ